MPKEGEQIEDNTLNTNSREKRDNMEASVEGKSSIGLTSFNLVNAIVGSGVIGMPYALRSAGLGLGVLICVAAAIITDVSLCLMIAVAQRVQVHTYQDLVRTAFGRPGFILASIIQFLYPFTCLVSYNIIVGDTLTKVIIRVTGIEHESFLVRREFIVAASTFLITLPLSLYRNISRLAKISLVSVVITFLIVVAMMVRFLTMEINVPSSETWVFQGPNVGAAIGVMSFAFMCHHASFLMYDSLQDNTQMRWNKTIHISICFSAILSLTFAITGYFTFSVYAQGDIFDNYCWEDDLMNVARGFFAFEILLTFPIECFVARDILETTFFRPREQHGEQYSLIQQPPSNKPYWRHVLLAVILVLSSMGISMASDCLGIVLEINGIICAVPLACFFPSLCYLKLAEGNCWDRYRFSALGVCIFGVIFWLLGAISLFRNFETLSKCYHGKELFYCISNDNETSSFHNDSHGR